MYRLIALHALGYMFCFGLFGLQIALEEVATPTRESVVVSITVPQPDMGERALSDGLAFYKVATTQEDLGIRSEAIPSSLTKARECLTAAARTLRRPSRLVEAYYLLGDSYLHGDFDPVRAERFLLRALDLDASHFRAAASLAKCYSMMGLPIQESTAWERALMANPRNARAQKAAALAYARSPLPNRLEHAYDHAVAAIRLDPSMKQDLEEVLASAEKARTGLRAAADAGREAPESSLEDIIDRGHEGKLTDAEAERYAEEIGRLLQDR